MIPIWLGSRFLLPELNSVDSYSNILRVALHAFHAVIAFFSGSRSHRSHSPHPMHSRSYNTHILCFAMDEIIPFNQCSVSNYIPIGKEVQPPCIFCCDHSLNPNTISFSRGMKQILWWNPCPLYTIMSLFQDRIITTIIFVRTMLISVFFYQTVRRSDVFS